VKTRETIVRFDPQTKKNVNAINFFSHSHYDHVSCLNSKAKNYMTSETKDILHFRGDTGSRSIQPIKYGESVQQDDLEIIAHNAGHMLGSAQFEVRSPNMTIVYTGDINYRNMLTTKAADVISCDILIIETTYGHPTYLFPRLGETCVEIVNWALGTLKENKIPVFKVYSTGKAQEIIKIFNEFTKIPVLVYPTVAKVNQAYEKNGVKLDYRLFNREEENDLLEHKQCVLVVPNNYKTFPARPHSLAVATGWVLKFGSSRFSGAFPVSGHADFKQLVTYVKEADPKTVFTTHGYEDYFANYLSKKLGINARPITSIKHKPLLEYL
jgi:putative mRNA 3-end processing factor